MTTLERLAPGDARGAALWDAFVLGCPQATFFHRAGWQTIMRDVFRHDAHFLFAQDQGRITGALHLADLSTAHGRDVLIVLTRPQDKRTADIAARLALAAGARFAEVMTAPPRPDDLLPAARAAARRASAMAAGHAGRLGSLS